jgi:hypothetical protein
LTHIRIYSLWPGRSADDPSSAANAIPLPQFISRDTEGKSCSYDCSRFLANFDLIAWRRPGRIIAEKMLSFLFTVASVLLGWTACLAINVGLPFAFFLFIVAGYNSLTMGRCSSYRRLDGKVAIVTGANSGISRVKSH